MKAKESIYQNEKQNINELEHIYVSFWIWFRVGKLRGSSEACKYLIESYSSKSFFIYEQCAKHLSSRLLTFIWGLLLPFWWKASPAAESISCN